MKLYEKLGFKEVGKRKEKIVRNGETIELINMEISRRDGIDKNK
jgi:RimJ/RimL family protein N-acetyltransferase